MRIEFSELEKARFSSWLEQETIRKREWWETALRSIGKEDPKNKTLKLAAFEFAAFSHVAKAVSNVKTVVSSVKTQNFVSSGGNVTSFSTRKQNG